MRPHFLYIGTSRAGSTWLYRLLRRHPQVFVPPGKGLYFFNREYGRGAEWYEDFFKEADPRRHRAMGEVTHDYLAHAEAPRRIFEYHPSMKFVIHLRDPMERLVSYYQFFLARAGWKMSGVSDFLKRRPGTLEEGLYARHLRGYLKYFPAGQFCVFDFNFIQNSPHRYPEILFPFLGCENIDYPKEILCEKVWANREPVFRFLNRLLDLSAVAARERALPNFMARIKYSKWVDRLLFKNKPVQTKLSEEERGRFSKYYRSDLEDLREVLLSFRNRHGDFRWAG